jgi:hypothetical protein
VYFGIAIHDVVEVKDHRRFLIDESSGQELPVPVLVMDDLENRLSTVEDRPRRIDAELRRFVKWRAPVQSDETYRQGSFRNTGPGESSASSTGA